MAFHANGFRSTGVMGLPASNSTPGNVRQVHTYITNDDRATIETSGYFNTLLTPDKKVRTGDLLHVSFDVDGTPGYRGYVINIVSSAVVLVPESGDDSGGGARAVVATADGLTTGLILGNDRTVSITNGGSVNNWSTLPAASASTIGREINIYCSTANSELRTPAAGADTINNVACGSAGNEALLTAGNWYRAIQTLATGWILIGWTNLGAVQTAIVPD